MPETMTKQQADKWIRFLRSYGPGPRNGNMYAEEIARLSRQYGIGELRFEHPMERTLFGVIDPSQGRLTNVVLTGTAGDGKTWLCYRLWEHLGGDPGELEDLPPYKPLHITGIDGPKTVHFIFDLSGWAPEKGQDWPVSHIDLLNRFATSVAEGGDEFFVLACNDGKLVQVWQELQQKDPESTATRMRSDLDELLATNQRELPGRRLLFLNLSRTKSVALLRLALHALMAREEWKCFDDLLEDPAYGMESPLRKNWRLLHDPLFVSRLEALLELCDANGFHIPIREVLMLLVNALLGHPKVNQHLMKAADARNVVANNTAALAAIHRNLFGDNLPARKREGSGVFGYLALFRVGQETSNEIDNLLLFGQSIPALRPHYERLVLSQQLYPTNPVFERLRQDYLNADNFGDEKREQFLSELANERRRLFFQIPESDEETLKVWELTVFQSAGKYRQQVLGPLAEQKGVQPHIIEAIVRGLNRAWSGMLIDDGTYLYLTSGLDFTTARISPIALHKIPVAKNYYGEQITVERDSDNRPVLTVSLLGEKVSYELNLLRFEFLDRVSQGSLPNSFSRECYEDVAAFKSRMLAVWQKTQSTDPTALRIVEIDDYGNPREHNINL